MSALWAGLFAAALGVAGLGLAYGLLHLREVRAPSRLWALIALFFTAAGIWETWLLVSGAYQSAPHLLGLFNGALLALGPCLFLQARAVAGIATPRWVQAGQFLPFLAHAVLLAIVFWPLERDQKLEIAQRSLTAAGQVDWISATKLAHLSIYGLLIIATARQGLARVQARLSRFDPSELYWIAGFAAALGSIAVVLLALSFVAPDAEARTLNNVGSLMLAILAVAIAARSLRDTRQPVIKPAPGYARSGLDKDRMAAFARRIEASMGRDALHTDPELTLDRLADAVGLTSQQVSQVLNQHLDVSFYRFVNLRRVEAAKALLDTSDLSVLEAAMQAGFATKATFNKTFKAETGLTPTQFRARKR